ncbi:hypothetical protein V473_11025 [Sphingobium cupriresistens LL01]|uniref:Uncharacterized protein n=2 Tax=Sphingobium cupriresistens TaxID=1132417 RepID=A0A0J7Y442_9SPHN|nr:hypothetical protein V473_11025 [Sphingobium cupriresistens LL01]
MPSGREEDRPPPITTVERSGGSSVVFALVALALILAIGFFYMTNERRGDRQADKVTQAAGSVDDAARVVGDAAKNAADTLRDGN